MEPSKSNNAGNNVELMPFMDSIKIAKPEVEPKKKRKKKRFFWMFFVTAFVAVSISAVSVGLYLKYKDQSNYMVSITIDPMVVDQRGETHVGGGKVSYNDTDSAEHYLVNLEVLLSYNQYFVYVCKIENKSSSDLDMSFQVAIEEKTNSLISYKIDNGSETSYTQAVENISIAKGNSIKLYLLIKIEDMDLNAYAKGNFSINISEAGVSSW